VIFYLRGIAVSSSIFFALYCVLSVAVFCGWRRIWRSGQNYSAERCADLLFALRIAPFVVAAAVTLAFVLPSFLRFEPRAIDEYMSGWSVVLGLSGIAVVLAGIWRALAALVRASRTVLRWSRGARVVESNPIHDFTNPAPVLRISEVAPPFAVSGILRCTLWLSRPAQFLLTERELQTALRHEVAHVRRRDNLRKLILHFVAFPGMTELENAWREATEMAADDAAVSSESDALDLAAAVLKLSRLISLHPPTALTAALLLHGPAGRLNARVRRLVAWRDRHQDRRPSPAQKGRLGFSLSIAAMAAAILAMSYGPLLVHVHEATECLMR
jgi:beta-lactamase regulating signal transducer with metallopeptidase domain